MTAEKPPRRGPGRPRGERPPPADRHTPAFFVDLPVAWRPGLEALASRSGGTVTGVVRGAVEARLTAARLWPPRTSSRLTGPWPRTQAFRGIPTFRVRLSEVYRYPLRQLASRSPGRTLTMEIAAAVEDVLRREGLWVAPGEAPPE